MQKYGTNLLTTPLPKIKEKQAKTNCHQKFSWAVVNQKKKKKMYKG